MVNVLHTGHMTVINRCIERVSMPICHTPPRPSLRAPQVRSNPENTCHLPHTPQVRRSDSLVHQLLPITQRTPARFTRWGSCVYIGYEG